MRDAVARYRQPTLAGELRGAQEILGAADIACQIDCDARLASGLRQMSVPQASEAALAWAVREGVTKVIRHSRARHCHISLAHGEGTVSLEIINDGINGINTPSSGSGMSTSSGNGLRGLHERIAALGGQYEAGVYPDGGFRLSVAVPK